MTIADNAQHRAAWLARVARIQLQLTDLKHEIDIAMRQRPALETIKRLAESDVHLSVALVELTEAAQRIRQLP